MTSFADVVRLRAAPFLLGALVLVGCVHSKPERTDTSAADETRGETAAEEPASAELTVVDGRLTRTTWAMANTLYGLPGKPRTRKVGGVVHAPLAGTLSPAAVPSPRNKRLIAYNSFHRKRPVLRLHDVRSGDDSVLDVGTYTLAWSRAAGLAYFKGLTERVRDPARYRGHVVVRTSPSARPLRWTAHPGRYAVSAWAGNRLIVHQFQQRSWANLVVFDGPKRMRVLAKRALLVALSPDGKRAFITRQPDPSPTVSVVDVADGSELATFTFSDEVDPIRGQPINYVADSGAWAGDTVIAGVTGGIAVFRVSQDEIVLEELLGVDPEAFPLGLMEPKSDATGRYVVAVAELQQKPRAVVPRVSLMECDLVKRGCVLGRSGPSFLPPRPVYNPSRP